MAARAVSQRARTPRGSVVEDDRLGPGSGADRAKAEVDGSFDRERATTNLYDAVGFTHGVLGFDDAAMPVRTQARKVRSLAAWSL